MKDLIIAVALTISILSAFVFVSQIEPAKAEIKPVCIEAHLGLNKSESIVLCGKLVSL